jgi:hypothetical protein
VGGLDEALGLVSNLRDRAFFSFLKPRKGFERDAYSHTEVFGNLRDSPFTLIEATEYLEVAEITLMRWIQSGLIKHNKVGRNFVFDPD